MAMNSSPKYSIQALVSAPITSRAIRNTNTPTTGPQKLTRPPPTSVIITT